MSPHQLYVVKKKKKMILNVSEVELAEHFRCRARDLRHQQATGVLAVRKY